MRHENLTCVAATFALFVAGCGNSQDGHAQSPSVGASGGVTNVGGMGGGPPGVAGIVNVTPGAGGVVQTGAGGVVQTGTGGIASMQGSGGTAPPPGTGGSPAPGAGGSGQPPPPAGVETIQINLSPFTIDPGAEVFMCQNYDNPFGGKDAAIQRSESTMTPGSHHLHLFYGASDASRNLASCSGFEFHPLLHAAQTPDAVSQYPAGMAAKLQGSQGVRLQVHYLNTTSNPLNVDANVKLTTVDASTVTKWVAQLYFNRVGLSVPPGPSVSVTTTCTIPQTYGPIGLLGGVSHMHRRATHFVASTSTGVNLYETDQWDEPVPNEYNPPVALNPGDKITWTCTYNNNTGQTLTFGDSASVNEMCIFTGRFYSSPTGQDMECQAYGPNN